MAKKSKSKTKVKRPATLRSWTKDEVKSLRTGIKTGMKAPELALVFDRTEGAVRQKAFALELSFRTKGPKTYKNKKRAA